MMRKILFYLPIILILTSCKDTINFSVSNSSISITKAYTYEDIKHLQIEWKDINNLANSTYFTYFYDEKCHYCNSIKNDIIDFAISDKVPIYFVKSSNDIQFGTYIENTIGESNLSYIFIKGFPSLICFEKGKVSLNIYGSVDILNLIKNY